MKKPSEATMTENRYNVERTTAGYQYVIPGTEKPLSKPQIRFARDGDQLVIPGAERISASQFVTRLVQRPLRPRAAQRSHESTPLFRRDLGR